MRRLTPRETLSNFSKFFTNTFAPPSLKKQIDPATPTEPAAALVSLKDLKAPDLVSRMSLVSNPIHGEEIRRLSAHEQLSFWTAVITSNILAGQKLTPEEKELLTRILTY
jgi:hypothetical protein